jgi:hypothetical protein
LNNDDVIDKTGRLLPDMHWSIPFLAVLLIGCQAREATESSAPINAEYTILTDDLSMDSVKSLYPSMEPERDLERKQVEELLTALPGLLIHAGSVRADERDEDLKEVLSNLDKNLYRFQLVTFRLDGRLHVFINALDNRMDFPNWRSQYQSVSDGGSSFWFCVYDLERRQIVQFAIHGHA